MAIEILGAAEVAAMRRAGRAAAATLAMVGARISAGISTADIDAWVRADTARRGGRPSQLGFHGFPAAVCTSRNAVVCHGIPSPRERLAPGDIINVDVTTDLGGFHGDTSATFFVGEPSADARHVVETARRCRDAGIAEVRDGVRLGDIGAAIEELAAREGCTVVRDFGGHGIGRRMHAPPTILHVGPRGMGLRLREGMAITIEPMINLGGPDVRQLDDGWTIVTADGSLSAQFEHTVLVTRDRLRDPDRPARVLNARPTRGRLRRDGTARHGRRLVRGFRSDNAAMITANGRRGLAAPAVRAVVVRDSLFYWMLDGVPFDLVLGDVVGARVRRAAFPPWPCE